MISDGFGDPAHVDSTLRAYHQWLHRMAYEFLPPGSPLHEDLVQEGRIAMWRALETYEAAQGALASWITKAARMKMKDIAHGTGQETGKAPMRGSRPADESPLANHLTEEGEPTDVSAVFLAIDAMNEVEVAYHHGEIAQAISSLSPRQQEYVLLRFWGGLDPASRSPGVRTLMNEYPVIKQRWLWSGTQSQAGAKARLAEQLQHLVDV